MPGGKRLFLLIIDDMSSCMWLVLLAAKDEVTMVITHFRAHVGVEAQYRVVSLWTDNSGEFMVKDFMEQCADEGIQHHLTTLYTPQQNGVVERHNQTMLGMARSMMKSTGMPNWMWGEAMLTAVFILNRLPTRSVNGKTLYEA
jgi:transposase InsO family protein